MLETGLVVERWLDDIGYAEVADSTYGHAEDSPPYARVGELVLGVALAAVSVRLFVVERRQRGATP